MPLVPACDSTPSSLASFERVADGSSTDGAQIEALAHVTASLNTDDSSNTADNTHTKPAATHVRICPHHTLLFQQLHEVATAPPLEEDRSLEILVKLYPPHRFEVEDGTEPQLRSQFYIHNSARFDPGFELSACWQAVLSRSKDSDYSKENMRHMLDRSDVWLCPHIKLCNNWVINAMFRILEHNEGGLTDKGLEGLRDHCTRCDTAVQVRCLTERPLRQLEARLQVKTKRPLGGGLCEDDEVWLRQCVPIADGKGKGNEIDGRKDIQCGIEYIRGMIHPSA